MKGVHRVATLLELLRGILAGFVLPRTFRTYSL